MNTSGTVKIHGREYKTVALRVQEFRAQCPAKDGWAIITDIIDRNDKCVVVKAWIDKDGTTLATGLAEEMRAASQINKTSALENCETSAIGRALAAFGLGGSEYASANEVQNAIQQQQQHGLQPKPFPHQKKKQQPQQLELLSAEENTYVTDTLKVIAAADHTDLENLKNDIETKSATIKDALRKAWQARSTFLKTQENQNAENPEPQKR